jgi:hypothetical protein
MTIFAVCLAIFAALWLRAYPDNEHNPPAEGWMLALVLLLIAHAVGGCAVDAEPQRYTCSVIYRCAGAADLEARLAMPCATSQAEAEQLATDAAIAHATELCGAADAWATVRPLCTLYDPATACELTDDVAEQ